MKTAANEIRNAWVNSYSPLVITVLYTEGNSEQMVWYKAAGNFTPGAQAKVAVLISKYRSEE